MFRGGHQGQGPAMFQGPPHGKIYDETVGKSVTVQPIFSKVSALDFLGN